jgi:hypothetical protein
MACSGIASALNNSAQEALLFVAAIILMIIFLDIKYVGFF